ncbi:vWA domain-containing protein [Candidatus Magnetaquicoccus inordinatus]|uniref:vWA domain-containing protein n=1 Tax=Candidatus Magnetaquicoccus inordinatus TaxID=2496818 RepID=UPI00187D3FF0|nr:VWA domain-containing protein [Candidatus Magnetaquicoccus inordinatus]
MLFPAVPANQDRFPQVVANALKVVKEERISTFSVDVDTASYAFLRRTIHMGQLPQADAVRVEELINYFDYDYPLPKSLKHPFQPTVALFPAPWNEEKKLMLVGIKGYAPPPQERPPAHLTLLVDVSGSMAPENRLPLLRTAFSMMVNQLRPEDTVAVVVYASDVGIRLQPTAVAEKEKILEVIDSLQAGGATAGGSGIRMAYELAKKTFNPKAVNRVILATDGDFNVGMTSLQELQAFISEQRKSGIYLSVLGVGYGNYNDALMQSLAQNGNGVAAYIDSLTEARRVLVDNLTANLFPIANDVKIQVEFNPARVSEYRLLGYETRMLKREDFNNDKVDAGDVGAGHSVTALYELTLTGSKGKRAVEPLRYGEESNEAEESVTAATGQAQAGGKGEKSRTKAHAQEYAFLKMRYKTPGESNSQLLEQPITDKVAFSNDDEIPANHRFAAAVAAFGLKLRNDSLLGDFSYARIVEQAQKGKGEDGSGLRAEFINMVKTVQARQR